MFRVLSLIFTILFMCMSAYAENVCVKDGTYIGILRKNVDVNCGTANACTESCDKIVWSSANKEWKVEFDYKTITGIASCYSTSGTFGNKNENFAGTTSSTGRYCWCKMEPVQNYGYYTGMSSFWVYLKDYGSGNNAFCADGCTESCARAMAKNSCYSNFRTALFNTIQIGSTPSQSSCPSGYVNLETVSSGTFAAQSSGSCSEGYYAYDTSYSCSTGYKWTNGTCAELCRLGSSNSALLAGQTVSLFANPMTANYLTVGYNTGKCYISLASGTTADSGLNIKTAENTYYHTID